MNSNKFTIVIPTRERSDTLFWSLKTCVNQDYDNLEIIVSDNCSQDDTKNVVESFNDSRVRYVNTGKRIGMSDNWEFALSKVSKGYVLFIGDDDGILPNAVKDIDAIISKNNNPLVFTWKYPYYFWKSAAVSQNHNLLRYPVSNLKNRLVTKNSKEELLKLSKFESDYTMLPCIYNGSFVDTKVIQKIKKISKLFFNSISPDVYSSVAILAATDSFLFSEMPYSISGLSKHSNGVSQLLDNEEKTKKEAKVEMFFNESSIKFHSEIDYCPSLPFIIAESFLQAVDNNILPISYQPTMKNVIRNAFEISLSGSFEKYNQVIDGIRKNAERNNLTEWAENLINSATYKGDNLPTFNEGYNPSENTIWIDMNSIGVSNIYEATLAVKTLNQIQSERLNNPTKLKYILRNTMKAVGRNVLPKGMYFPLRRKLLPYFNK